MFAPQASVAKHTAQGALLGPVLIYHFASITGIQSECDSCETFFTRKRRMLTKKRNYDAEWEDNPLKKDFLSKPYNRCLTCPHRQTACDGPRTAAMPLIRWKEFMRDMKDINGLTYAEIAEKSGLSERTVQNKLSEKNDEDVMRETARLIENAIIGSSNQYPCYLAFQDSLPKESRTVSEVEHEMEELRKNISMIHESYRSELEKVRKEAQEKINFLKGQIEFKEKIISKLLDKS